MRYLEHKQPSYTYELPQPSVAETWEELKGFSRPVQVGVHSYFEDGTPLIAAFATGLESGSFKERNGIVETQALTDRGIEEAVLFSAGNHSAGVALGARATGIYVHAFVPESAPQCKVDLSLELGQGNVDVTRVKGGLDRARHEANSLAEELNVPIIEPYLGNNVARAQGTVMHELLMIHPDIEIVFIPEGGGGLEAGVIKAIREYGSRAKVYGVKMSSEHELCEGAHVRNVGAVALNARFRNPNLWGKTVHVSTTDVGRMVALEDNMRGVEREAMGEAAYDDYPEATALMGAAAAHKNYKEFEGKKIATIITGSNADHGKLDILHRRYIDSLSRSRSSGLRVASGYQLRKSVA